MSCALFIAVAMFANAGTVCTNGDFSKGLDGWQANATAPKSTEIVSRDGRNAAHISSPADAPVGYPGFRQEVPVVPGNLITFSADAFVIDTRDGYGAYIALEFYDADGKRISFGQSGAAPSDGAWHLLKLRAYAPPDAAKTQLCLLLNGHGEAFFSNVIATATTEESPSLPYGPVTIAATTEKVCDSLKGFGAEDDGWSYNSENTAHGVTEADYKLREDRVRWMNPAWIRMFCWYKDWNPSGDWQTFDFDSDNMRSHYRTLDLYQSLGATVNIVGVEWGMGKFDSLDKTANAIGALFEHLIRDKGYTCVREWTLSNEPNTTWIKRGNSFEDFVRLHTLVKEEFKRRGLKVSILGSDDTSGLPWFEDCVKNDHYFGAADFFASHLYAPFADRKLAPFFFDDRLEPLRARKSQKPFVLAEFGFHDTRSGAIVNPVMETYPYAIWTSSLVIDALNKGVAGFSIWCLHETYYPGNGFMNYGLWNYKDRAWGVRPVYTAWSNFTRFARPGDAVYRCTSSSPAYVSATRVGKTVFWVNQAERVVQVKIQGITPTHGRAYDEKSLSGDRECGSDMVPAEDAWSFPAQSFGRLEE